MAAPKLKKEAQLLIIERIVAGDTNHEIRAKLREKGFPEIVDASIGHYRGMDAVKAGIALRFAEACQSGFGSVATRVKSLTADIRRIDNRLAPAGEIGFRSTDDHSVAALLRAKRDHFNELGKLVDKQTLHVEHTGADGAPIEVALSPSQLAEEARAIAAGKRRAAGPAIDDGEDEESRR
jgi:hypothetical protein